MFTRQKTASPAMLLLALIYLAFISLGLPDGILGVTWPFIRAELREPLENAGILTALLTSLSALSSVVSGYFLRRFGTGGVTFVSCLTTGLALLGFSFAPRFFFLALCAVPLGLGQGAVDSGLNAYVAGHYSARHMNWLHCFWGVGASSGALLVTEILTRGGTWRGGYRSVALIQLALSAVLLASLLLGMWNRSGGWDSGNPSRMAEPEGVLSGFWPQLLAVLLFFLYSGMEFSCGMWINTVFVESRHFSIRQAGLAATAFYGAIMAGRFICGIVVGRLGNGRMIRVGLAVGASGCLLCAFSRAYPVAAAGVILIGLGLSPIYPCLMHETPKRFRKPVAERLIGLQVGAACLGGSVISAGAGLMMARLSLETLFPLLAALIAISYVSDTILRRQIRARRAEG